MEILPNWHPVFVHFTVALMTVSTLLFLVSKFATNWRLEDQWLATAYWNLWIGTLVSIGTALAGWYAFNTVDHDTESHKVMLEHRNYAISALAVFAVLAVWAIFQYRAERRPSAFFILAALLGWGLVLTTAWHGGELVYRHGLGVMSLPKAGPHAHSEGAAEHSHPEGVAADHGHAGEDHADGAGVTGGDHHHDAMDSGNHHDDSAAPPHAHDAPSLSAQPDAAPAAPDVPAEPPSAPVDTAPAAASPPTLPAETDAPQVDATAPVEPAGEPQPNPSQP